MAAMIEVKCQNCKDKFEVRVADRKRGWGKFCSKSCKAIKQEGRTGQNRLYRERRDYMSDHDRAMFDSSTSHGQDGSGHV